VKRILFTVLVRVWHICKKIQRLIMADEKQTSRSPEYCFDKIEVSQDFVSPTFKSFLPANEYFFSDEYLLSPEFDSLSRVTPRRRIKLKTSRKTFLKEKSNDDEFETPKKIAEEDDIEFLRYKNLRMSSCCSEMNFTRPKYRNNISPAIENLIRIMGIPFLLTPEDSRTRRALSPDLFDSRISYDDFAVSLLNRKCRDASSASPKTPVTSRRHSLDSCTLKAMLTKVTDSSSPRLAQKFLSRYQSLEFIDIPRSDERVIDSSYCEIKESPQCVEIAEEDEETFHETTYVSEAFFLLMASNRNRSRAAILSRSSRSRTQSRNGDSAFSDLTASDQE